MNWLIVVWNNHSGSLFLFAFCLEHIRFLSWKDRVVFCFRMSTVQRTLLLKNKIRSPEFPFSRYNAVSNLCVGLLLSVLNFLLTSPFYWVFLTGGIFFSRFLSLTVPCFLFFIVHYLRHTISFQSFIFVRCILSYLHTFLSHFSCCCLVSCSCFISFAFLFLLSILLSQLKSDSIQWRNLGLTKATF